MRIQELDVDENMQPTAVADGQTAELPGAEGQSNGANGAQNKGPEGAELPGAEAQNFEPCPDAELNRNLEETEGEYGPPNEETEATNDKIEELREESDGAHETIAALESYYHLAKRVIDRKSYSQESLDLIRFGVESRMKQGKNHLLTMEGREGAGIDIQHQLALEGIKESIKSALHSVYTANAAIADNVKMLFTSIESDVKRYESGLDKAVEKFEEFLKINGKEKLHVDLHVLNNFFNVTRQQVNRLPSLMKEDLDFDGFVLRKYSAMCESQIDAFGELLAREKNFGDLTKGVEKLKHPFEMFDKKYISDAYTTPLLGGYHAIRDYPLRVKRTDAFGAFNKLSKMEQLGSNARIKIIQAPGNAVRAVYTSMDPLYHVVGGATSEVLSIEPGEVRQLAQLAREYLKNIEFYMQALKNIVRSYERAEQRLLDFESEDIIQRNANQMFHYLNSLEYGAVTTCRQEVSRALKAVFYTIALINRTTFTNK